MYVETYAVVVGIEDYDSIGDLDYCENDAYDWYNQLTNNSGLDFDDVELYLDSSGGCDGRAEEKTVKDALIDMISKADGGDIIAFVFSGHSHENTSSSHALAMWDAEDGLNDEDGYLYDTEIKEIFDDSLAERVLLFFDCCHGGAFYSDINSLSNKNQFFLSGGDLDGQAYVDATNENGCWTQCFLNYAYMIDKKGDITASYDSIYVSGRTRYNYHVLQGHQYYSSAQSPTKSNWYGEEFCLSKYGITPQ